MFDPVLRSLLRLYPRAFRDQYCEEMLLFVRDRRNENDGAPRQVFLLLEFVWDLTIALPGIYLRDRRRFSECSEIGSGPITFRLVEAGRPSYWVVLASIILSLGLLHSIRSLHHCPGEGTNNGSAISMESSSLRK